MDERNMEALMLLLTDREATYAMTLEPDEFWAWWATSDREVPGAWERP